MQWLTRKRIKHVIWTRLASKVVTTTNETKKMLVVLERPVNGHAFPPLPIELLIVIYFRFRSGPPHEESVYDAR